MLFIVLTALGATGSWFLSYAAHGAASAFTKHSMNGAALLALLSVCLLRAFSVALVVYYFVETFV